MSYQRYLKNVATLKLNQQKCIGCGMCQTVCPHSVFMIADKKSIIMDKDACMECGACANNCPTQALSVSPGAGCAYALLMNFFKGTATCDCSNPDKG
jgi:ferredoxin